MDQIILDVDDQTAKAWRSLSSKLRAEIGKSVGEALMKSLDEAKEINFELLLQELRNEAEKNGLTEKILTELLNKD